MRLTFFEPEIFGTKKFSNPKVYGAKKYCELKIFDGPKFFYTPYFLDPALSSRPNIIFPLHHLETLRPRDLDTQRLPLDTSDKAFPS